MGELLEDPTIVGFAWKAVITGNNADDIKRAVLIQHVNAIRTLFVRDGRGGRKVSQYLVTNSQFPQGGCTLEDGPTQEQNWDNAKYSYLVLDGAESSSRWVWGAIQFLATGNLKNQSELKGSTFEYIDTPAVTGLGMDIVEVIQRLAFSITVDFRAANTVTEHKIMANFSIMQDVVRNDDNTWKNTKDVSLDPVFTNNTKVWT